MNTSRNTLVLFLFATLLFSCSEEPEIAPTNVLKISNALDSAVVYQIGNIYPDTMLWENTPFTGPSIEKLTIEPGGMAEVPLYFSSYPPEFTGRTCLYFFDKTTLLYSMWDSIRDNYMILDRFDFNEEDLDQLNWEVEIPLD